MHADDLPYGALILNTVFDLNLINEMHGYGLLCLLGNTLRYNGATQDCTGGNTLICYILLW